jgi:hypothetical protein
LPAGFPFDRARADLAHLHGDGPAATGSVFPQSAILHRQSLLISSRHACVQSGAQHFRLSSWLAENVRRFHIAERPFHRHFRKFNVHGRIGSFKAMHGYYPEGGE